MIVKTKELLKSVSRMIGKEDIQLMVMKDAKMGVMAMTDVQSGIQVQSKLSIENIEEDYEFYLPSAIKNPINAISQYAKEELELHPGAGTLVVSSEKSAKIKLSLLSEEPKYIKIKNGIEGFQINGEAFSFAMNEIASLDGKIVFEADSNTIDIFGITGIMVMKTSVKVHGYINEKENIEEEKVVKKSEDKLIFSISSNIWKKISGIFSKEFQTLHVANGQLKFMSNDMAIIIPMENLLDKNASGVFDSIWNRGNSFEVAAANCSDVFNALSVAVLEETTDKAKVTVIAKDSSLKFKTLCGSAVVNISSIEQEWIGTFNGKLLKEFYGNLRKCSKPVMYLTVDKRGNIFKSMVKKEFEYFADEDSDRTETELVEIRYILCPIN